MLVLEISCLIMSVVIVITCKKTMTFLGEGAGKFINGIMLIPLVP